MDQWGARTPYFRAPEDWPENIAGDPFFPDYPYHNSLESAFSGLSLAGAGDHHPTPPYSSPARLLVDPTNAYYYMAAQQNRNDNDVGGLVHRAHYNGAHQNLNVGPQQNILRGGSFYNGYYSDQQPFLQSTKPTIGGYVPPSNLNIFGGQSLKSYHELAISGTSNNLRGKVVSLAKDQQGSKMLQAKLEKGNKEEIEVVLREVMDYVGDLMKNQSGSYVIQKLFVVCNEEQRTSIIQSLTRSTHQFIGICISQHGARAMQKLLENLSTPQQTSLITSALTPVAVALANDQSGHHVIQYCVKTFSIEYTRHLLNEIANNCFRIATQKSGCCVLQSCVEFSHGELRDRLITEILTNAVHLSEDQYGNYVVQHLVGLKLPRVTEALLERLQGNFANLSCNKYASNVVEKIILESGEVHSTKIIAELLGSPNASMLLVDPFGNFVIQTALQVSKGQVFKALCALIYMNSPSMESNIYGKKILDRLLNNKKEPLHSVRLYKRQV